MNHPLYLDLHHTEYAFIEGEGSLLVTIRWVYEENRWICLKLAAEGRDGQYVMLSDDQQDALRERFSPDYCAAYAVDERAGDATD